MLLKVASNRPSPVLKFAPVGEVKIARSRGMKDGMLECLNTPEEPELSLGPTEATRDHVLPLSCSPILPVQSTVAPTLSPAQMNVSQVEERGICAGRSVSQLVSSHESKSPIRSRNPFVMSMGTTPTTELIDVLDGDEDEQDHTDTLEKGTKRKMNQMRKAAKKASTLKRASVRCGTVASKRSRTKEESTVVVRKKIPAKSKKRSQQKSLALFFSPVRT